MTDAICIIKQLTLLRIFFFFLVLVNQGVISGAGAAHIQPLTEDAKVEQRQSSECIFMCSFTGESLHVYKLKYD